jgi:hypothetical protein
VDCVSPFLQSNLHCSHHIPANSQTSHSAFPLPFFAQQAASLTNHTDTLLKPCRDCMLSTSFCACLQRIQLFLLATSFKFFSFQQQRHASRLLHLIGMEPISEGYKQLCSLCIGESCFSIFNSPVGKCWTLHGTRIRLRV